MLSIIIIVQDAVGKDKNRRSSALPAGSDYSEVEADAVADEPEEYFEEEPPTRRKARRNRGI